MYRFFKEMEEANFLCGTCVPGRVITLDKSQNRKLFFHVVDEHPKVLVDYIRGEGLEKFLKEVKFIFFFLFFIFFLFTHFFF